MTKCRKNDKNPSLACLLKGMGHEAGVVGSMVGHGLAAKASRVAKQQKTKKLPPKSQTIANSLVGNVKAGHGGFCHANKIKKMNGSRVGGEGLKRL